MRVDLADHVDAVAATGDGFGNDFLCAAFAVHLGGVDQRQSEIEAKLKRLDLGCLARVLLAHAPGAETKRGDRVAVQQSHRAHDVCLQLAKRDGAP